MRAPISEPLAKVEASEVAGGGGLLLQDGVVVLGRGQRASAAHNKRVVWSARCAAAGLRPRRRGCEREDELDG